MRDFWRRRLLQLWEHRSVLWLRGVRRTGKTWLSQSIEGVEYFDCELPRVRRAMDDPEAFLKGLRGKRIVLDEIHRLPQPSELLKIAADHFPDVRVLATGSSTLGASHRFRDTLAGRKAELWLTPMVEADLVDFGRADLSHRLLHGGLPPFFLSPELPERDFQEWMEAKARGPECRISPPSRVKETAYPPLPAENAERIARTVQATASPMSA